MSANPSNLTHSFTSLAIGTANANRLVIVAAFAVTGSTSSGLDIDVGGISGIQAAGNFGTNRVARIAYAIVPSGTTATITVSNDAQMNNLELGYWTAILAAGEDYVDGGFNLASAISSSVTISYSATSGFAVAFCIENSNAADQTQAIDKGFVEDAEQYTSAIATNAMYAHLEPALSGVGAVTHTLNASSTVNMITMASFGAGPA